MFDPAQLIVLGSDPIASDSPTGESVRYEDSFTELETEIGKLDNPAAGEPDWNLARERAQSILSQQSKDLLVAAYLGRCLYQSDGLEGLAAGLTLCRNLLANFWDQLHPQRVRARRAALVWLGERMEALLDPADPNNQDALQLERCRDLVAEIIDWSGDRFDGEDCGLLGLRRSLETVQQALAGDAPAGGDDGGEAGNASAEMSSIAGDGASVASGRAGPITGRAQAVARIQEVADWFGKAEPHSPVGPLLRRAIDWTGKGFDEIFSELLRDRNDAREHIWDVLGIRRDED